MNCDQYIKETTNESLIISVNSQLIRIYNAFPHLLWERVRSYEPISSNIEIFPENCSIHSTIRSNTGYVGNGQKARCNYDYSCNEFAIKPGSLIVFLRGEALKLTSRHKVLRLLAGEFIGLGIYSAPIYGGMPKPGCSALISTDPLYGQTLELTRVL